MKNLFTLFLLAIFAVSAIFGEPQPPFFESKLGYLVAREDSVLSPPVKKIFILPQEVLPIFSEKNESIQVLAKLDEETTVCKIPKQVKFSTLIRISDDGKNIISKGPMELETLSVEIKRGEELPVEKISKTEYTSFIKRNGLILTVKILKNDERFSFEKESFFAKFAEKQKQKGLVYFDNEWLDELRAEERKKEKEENLRKLEEKKKNIIHGASSGFVVLSNGTVLVGRMSGQYEDGIIFEGDGRVNFVKFADLADLNFDDIIACGRIFSARKLIRKNIDLDFSTVGKVKKDSDEALEHLENLPSGASERFQKEKMEIAKLARKKIVEVQSFLDANGLSLYKYKPFSSDVLKWQLANGNILLGDSWIKPSQKCLRCGASGRIICVTCDGNGKIKEKCSFCENGKEKCVVCAGDGWRACSSCKGLGTFSRRCLRCNGTGFISRLTPFKWMDDVEIIGGTVIIKSRRYPLCYYETFQFCPDCGGSGIVSSRCQACGGTGRISCPKSEKCKICEGVGWAWRRCVDCSGRGSLLCSDCSGRGFAGEEQRAQ